jgi:hypothetical protein
LPVAVVAEILLCLSFALPCASGFLLLLLDNPNCALLPAVIPANAGIQRLQAFSPERPWIPAFAGMTSRKCKSKAEQRQAKHGKEQINLFYREANSRPHRVK